MFLQLKYEWVNRFITLSKLSFDMLRNPWFSWVIPRNALLFLASLGMGVQWDKI